MNPALASIPAPPPAQEPRPTRPNILTVQGCAGCNRPARVRVETVFGRIQKVNLRLKMTRIPGAFTTVQRHPRRAPVARKYPVFAKLCKSCRKLAQVTTAAPPELAEHYHAPEVGKVQPAVPVLVT